MKRLLSFICVFVLAVLRIETADSQIVRYRNCSVDAEILKLPACALETKNGHLYVSDRYLKLFFLGSNDRLGSRVLPDGGWAYFDRRGLIFVKNVAQYDNGADDFHFGLVRVVRDGKWGLSNSHGLLIVPFEYDGMLGFDDSHKGWMACKGCHTVKVGQYDDLEGGQWFWLDRQGHAKASKRSLQ